MKFLFQVQQGWRELGSAEWKRSFVAWLAFSLVTHLVCSDFSVGYHAIDEHFQILEFLNFKLGQTPQVDLPMEYAARLRPWLQPAFYYGIVQGLKTIGIQSPFTWAWVFRLFCSLVGWWSLVGMGICSRFWFKDARAQKFCLAAIGLLWFLPPLHARPSSEGLGGSFFMLGLCTISLMTLPGGLLPSGWAKVLRSRWTPLAAGLLFGLSFESRFQMALMIGGVFLWVLFFAKRPAKELLGEFTLCTIGFLLIFGLGRWADAWGYGEWTWSPWNYFHYNIWTGGVEGYGQSPWWEVFRVALTEVWPPFGLLMLMVIIMAWIRHPRHLITWAQVPFFLVHEMIGHKELRFFFPLLHAGPVLLTMGWDSGTAAASKLADVFQMLPRKVRLLGRWIFKALCGALLLNYAVAFLTMIFAPANRTVDFYQALDQQRRSHPEMQTLFTVDRDPYTVFGTPTYFYRPSGIRVEWLTSPQLLVDRIQHSSSPVYVVHSRFELPQEAPELKTLCHLVEPALPEWMQALKGFDRVSVWGLFECGRRDPHG